MISNSGPNILAKVLEKLEALEELYWSFNAYDDIFKPKSDLLILHRCGFDSWEISLRPFTNSLKNLPLLKKVTNLSPSIS